MASWRRESLVFFDLRQRYEGLDKKNDPLAAIGALVPFEAFRKKLNAALIAGGLRTKDADRKSAAGLKPWDELRAHQAYVMPTLRKGLDAMVRAVRGFHSNNVRRKVYEE